MLKRLIAILIVPVLAVMMPCAANAEVSGGNLSDMQEELFYLKALNVFDDEFEPGDGYLTRAEMAMLAVRLGGVSDVTFGEAVFSDVDAAVPYCGYISYASSIGAMTGSGGVFSPERYISGYEAAKTLVASLGYSGLAASKGGYPGGYMVCASELGILKNTSDVSASAVSTADALLMVFNALEAKPMQPVYGGEENYYIDTTTVKEYLEAKYELTWLEGIVTATSVTSISSGEAVDEGYVKIGEKIYSCKDANMAKLLAYPVYGYADKKGLISGLYKDLDSITEIEVAAKDIEQISASAVSYYEEDIERSLNIDESASFIFNGKNTSGLSEQDLKIYEGSIRFLNNDGDKGIDAVFIDETVSVAADYVYPANESVYFVTPMNYRGQTSIRLQSDDDDDIYNIIKPDGTVGSFADIQANIVLTISRSKDEKLTEVYLSDKSVAGKLEEISSDDKTVVIDGTVYEAAVSENGEVWLDAVIGESAVFLLDCAGRVVCKADETAAEKFAYVAAVSQRSGFTAGKVRLVTSGDWTKEEKESGNSVIVSYKYQNGKEIEASFASKVKFNGSSVSESDISASLLENKLIKYKLDSEGCIKAIDTYDAYNECALMNFNADIISFGGRSDRDSFLVGSSTQVICVPNVADSSDDWYQTVKCTDDSSYSVYGASIDEDTNIAGAVVIYEDMDADALVPIDADTKVSIVVNSSKVMDEEGNGVQRVLILTGDEQSYITSGSNAAAEKVMSSLRAGDLIRYSTDVYERVANIELLMSVSDLDRFYRANANSTNEEIYGRVTGVEIGKLSRLKNEFADKISIATDEWMSNAVSYELVRDDGPTMYVCNFKEKTIRAATGYDILGSEQFGTASASKVFMIVNNNDPQAVVIIE